MINGQLPEIKNMDRYDAGQDFPKKNPEPLILYSRAVNAATFYMPHAMELQFSLASEGGN
jgi:hypothetical protein